MTAKEPARPGPNPPSKLRDLWMASQFLNRVEISLELFFRKNFVNLGMTWSANANHPVNGYAIEFLFVPFIVMSGSRDEMMPGQGFFAATNRAPP